MNLETLQRNALERSMDMSLTTLEVIENQDLMMALDELTEEAEVDKRIDDIKEDYEQRLDDMEAERDAADTRAYDNYCRAADAIAKHVTDTELANKLHDAIDYVE